jgi:hypothetical protein
MTVVTEANLEQLHPHDRREAEAFMDFLSGPGRNGPGEEAHLWRDWPGWVPYVLGRFFHADTGGALLAPPAGYEATSVTAWTFPG